MVAAGYYLRPEGAVTAYRLTPDSNKWIAVKQLYLPDKHQRPVVPVILVEPGSKISNPELAVPDNEFS